MKSYLDDAMAEIEVLLPKECLLHERSRFLKANLPNILESALFNSFMWQIKPHGWYFGC